MSLHSGRIYYLNQRVINETKNRIVLTWIFYFLICQNTGVGSLSLLQGIFPSQGLNLGLPYCGWIHYQLKHRGSPRILEWSGYAIPSPVDLPNPGIEPGSAALQVDPLPAELPERHAQTQLWVSLSVENALLSDRSRLGLEPSHGSGTGDPNWLHA